MHGMPCNAAVAAPHNHVSDTPTTDRNAYDFRRGALWMLGSLAGFTGMALLVMHLGSTRAVSPWWALLFRALVGIVVVAVIYGPGNNVSFRRAATGRLLVSRGVLGALGTAAYYLTLPKLGAGKATLIGNTWTIWAAILAVPMLGEKMTSRKVVGLLLAIGGIALITELERGDLSQFGRYEVIAVAGALIAACVVVVIRQLTRTETSGTIFASQCLYSALLALPFCLMERMPGLMDFALLTLAALLAAVGQLGMTEGFRFLPVSVGGAFQMLLPLLITAMGCLLFAETFTLMQSLGAAFILAGCYGVVSQPKLPAKAGG
jgi:drug/metabolite transporter (DMT)-like permease